MSNYTTLLNARSKNPVGNPDWIPSAPSFDARTERLLSPELALVATARSSMPTNLERQ